MVLRGNLLALGHTPVSVELGEVEIAADTLSDVQLQEIKNRIEPLGFELLTDRKSRLIDQIKTSIIELVHRQESLEKIKISDYIKNKILQDYNHISQLFSATEKSRLNNIISIRKWKKLKNC